MMRRASWTALFLGAVLALWRFPAETASTADPEPPATYVGTESSVSVRFEYPAGWHLTEEHGTIDAYVSVRILGPRNAQGSYTAYIVVRSSPLQANGGLYPSARALVDHFLETAPAGAVVESRAATPVDGQPADDLTLSYTIPPFFHKGLVPVATQVKTRLLALERPPYLYELTYSADAQEYDTDAALFGRLVKSLRFR